MSNCAQALAYIAIGLLELIFIAGMGACVYAATQTNSADTTGCWIGFGSTLFAFLLFNCMLCCFRSKLQVAIAVIDATADYMAGTKRIALVTVYYFILALITLLLGGFGVVGTVAMNKISINNVSPGCSDSSLGSCEYTKEIHFTGGTGAMMGLTIFGLFWILCFFREKNKLIYMIGSAQFYFSSNKDQTGSARVVNAMAIANFKHAGSVALGSLIHTIVTIIKAIVDGMVNAAERDNRGNPAV